MGSLEEKIALKSFKSKLEVRFDGRSAVGLSKQIKRRKRKTQRKLTFLAEGQKNLEEKKLKN